MQNLNVFGDSSLLAVMDRTRTSMGSRMLRQWMLRPLMDVEEINERLHALAKELGVELETFQTNFEGEFCEKIHKAHLEKVDAVVVNAGAWTHYSIAVRDALGILKVPIIECHMSNIHAREEFRHVSHVSPLAKGIIAGFGVHSYLLSLQAAAELVSGTA